MGETDGNQWLRFSEEAGRMRVRSWGGKGGAGCREQQRKLLAAALGPPPRFKSNFFLKDPGGGRLT